jgi:DMSO/TMAO reductase YedYZ molybdopterin-dependent catalytic subunit
MSDIIVSRRRFIIRGAISFGALSVAGCDNLGRSPWVRRQLDGVETLTMRVQRLLQGSSSLAREYTAQDLSPMFRPNGTISPRDPKYLQLLENNFADWRLTLDGLVERPASYSLAELRALPARTQITRHDCVEGWSAIGGWTGVPLSVLLHSAVLKPDARYAVFYCADTLGGEPSKGGDERQGRYYESLDLVDAFHPQTILAYALNGQPLPVGNGAPLRLRVERQLGYKHAKYLMRIEITDRMDLIGNGKGGFWEDRGYEWYAGI